jgi:hypothetical protein
VISAQWEKLREIHFESLKVRAGRSVFTVKREWLLEMEVNLQRSFFEWHNPSSSSNSISRIASRLAKRDLKALSASTMPYSAIRAIANRNRTSTSSIEELHHILRRSSIDLSNSPHPKIKEAEHFFDENLEGRILYLPTYRRIEKDIKSIFPEIEDEIQRAIRTRRAKAPGSQNEVYVELVNFGMEDVHVLIEEKMEALRYLALSEIRSLSTRYLRDVIRNEANTYDPNRVRDFDQRDLRRIFANVDESLLSQPDQNKIYSVIEKIKTGENIEENERYVAHYISSLIDIGEKIALREKPVHEFARICNSYLFGKRFRFDNSGYSLPIEYGDGDSVEMEDLSSGEKQIVSLFAHMTLDESPNNYVIIDEPELSLSVDWQQKFLQDISDLDSCAFVGAVTHSPFVFENKLDDYAVDMISCIKQ